MVTTQDVAATAEMQAKCMDAYGIVMSSLHTGMSEHAIASAIRSTLARADITDYWYEVPVLVLIGEQRFLSLAGRDYASKQPLSNIVLSEDQPIFIDMHPRHVSGRWGNFAATAVYAARDAEKIAFLTQMQRIQSEGINQLSPSTRASDIARWFRAQFRQIGIEQVDPRGNFGHTMGTGKKEMYSRAFLDEECHQTLGGEILGVEPGGIFRTRSGRVLVARFEDCVYVPQQGAAITLGRNSLLPVSFSASGHVAP